MNLQEAIRIARGTESQQAFATRIGASIASLQRWESGERPPRSYHHVIALIHEGVPDLLLIGKQANA